MPVVAETLGGLAEDSIRTVRAIGRAIAQRASSPSDTSTATTQLFRRLAISLWRGNACLWLHRQPPQWTESFNNTRGALGAKSSLASS